MVEIPEFTTRELLTRARSVIGRKTRYRLGSGGRDPAAKTPGDPCDCSGYVCWCLRLSRLFREDPFMLRTNGGWINTTSIVADARAFGQGLFDRIDIPIPGCLMVYPWHGGRAGHVGIVTETRANRAVRVIHCSKGNDYRSDDAIMETPTTVFDRADTIFAWYRGLRAA